MERLTPWPPNPADAAELDAQRKCSDAAAPQTPDRRHATNFHSNPAGSFTVLTMVIYVPVYCRIRVHGVNTFRCVRRSASRLSRHAAERFVT